jgi:uncharacterized membrane protein YphA (DoxX/SURF4 family)
MLGGSIWRIVGDPRPGVRQVTAGHGAQKVFGWFGGYGLKGTGGFFETMGFRPGVLFAAMAGLSELAGGLLLVLGLLTSLGAAAVLAAMLVAMVSVHLKRGSSRRITASRWPSFTPRRQRGGEYKSGKIP